MSRRIDNDFSKYNRPTYDSPQGMSGYNHKNNRLANAFVLILIGAIILLTIFIFSLISPKETSPADLTNYKFTNDDLPNDLASSGFEFNLNPSEGDIYTIDHTHPDFIKTRNGNELKLIVGNQLKPGVYTVSREGDDINIKIDFALNNNRSYNLDQPMHNIQLTTGDIIKINNPSTEREFAFTFANQSEYVLYEPGRSGVFVFGLSYFDPQIKFSSGVHHLTYCSGNETTTCDVKVDDSASFDSSPGAYFIIDNNIQ